ncbi:hypothetical protein PISMIDRAFT_674384 [Pisolithus microcarpus 441]|uniref:Uncharacterized protein n=1 Tax=Pisolithus microcarpus 441 TaxID=765257 RepID=A0A0C9ZFK3_9AGAM|nr:hypothetical protein PISMIDRAFT_674384 [Pisolithus microcarpus 441]
MDRRRLTCYDEQFQGKNEHRCAATRLCKGIVDVQQLTLYATSCWHKNQKRVRGRTYTGMKLLDGSEVFSERCRRGLKIKTIISPKMMSNKRKMIFRRPVFFWYLSGWVGVTCKLVA